MVRPKTLEGKLTNFNSKVTEGYKKKMDAIINIGGYSSKREMLEDWTDQYLKDHPEKAEKVNDFIRLTSGE